MMAKMKYFLKKQNWGKLGVTRTVKEQEVAGDRVRLATSTQQWFEKGFPSRPHEVVMILDGVRLREMV